MNGGEISTNLATFTGTGNGTARGGGVHNSGSGTFHVTTGTILNNNFAATPGSNVLFLLDGVQGQFGTFNGPTWVPNGSLSTTNNTIRVVNGVLMP